MKIRKSIKVSVAVTAGVMLALVLFLAWDFSGSPSRQPLSIRGIVDSARQLLDFKDRRLTRYIREMQSYKTKVDEVEKASPDDVEVLMGIVELRNVPVGLERNEQTLEKIRSTWPQYRPAMAAMAWEESYVTIRRDWKLKMFDRLASRPSTDGMMRVDEYWQNELMLKKDDPFVQMGNKAGAPDPASDLFLVKDVAAARKKVAERIDAQANAAMVRLGQLAAKDPNNSLYDYLLARGAFYLGRTDEGVGYIKRATGKELDLYYAERAACLTKAMEKAKMPRYLQEFVLDAEWRMTCASSEGLADVLRKQAAQAELRGDADGAKALENAAAKLAPVPPTPKPTGRH